MDTVPLAEAKNRLSALVAEVASTHAHYTITRNGRPAAVLVPVEDLEALEETIFWLEREVERLRSGAPEDNVSDISGDEMAHLLRQRRLREDPSA